MDHAGSVRAQACVCVQVGIGVIIALQLYIVGLYTRAPALAISTRSAHAHARGAPPAQIIGSSLVASMHVATVVDGRINIPAKYTRTFLELGVSTVRRLIP